MESEHPADSGSAGAAADRAWAGWLPRACGWFALLLPMVLGIWQGSNDPHWRSDGTSLGLWGAPPAWQGVVSVSLGQLLQLLPIGATLSRAVTLGGVALGVAGLLVFRMTQSLLIRNATSPRLNPLLALCASVASTSCLSWLLEGTVVGGAALGAALALATLWFAGTVEPSGATGSSGRVVLVAALFSATALESLWAAVPTAIVLLVTLWQAGRVPSRLHGLSFLVCSAAVLAAGWLPALLGPRLAPLQGLRAESAASLHVGLGFEQLALVGGVPSSSLSEWFGEVGFTTCVAAALGVVWALLHRSLRKVLVPLALLVLVDLLVPQPEPSALVAQGRIAIHLLAIVAVVCSAALGLQTIAVFVQRAGLVGARPAVVLLTALTLAVTWAGAEDSVRVLAGRNRTATDSWTDEVLASLPYRSLVVVRSEAAVQRLGAALASGTRLDVVVVPLSLLGRGTLAAELLRLEPALALLIRELSTTGRPSEQALTVLADVRPLFVEADPDWDRRLLVHLVPGPFFDRFASHPLARSDRLAALSGQREAFERVMAAALGPQRSDAATLRMLSTGARREIALLELLGDREEARELTERLDALGMADDRSRSESTPQATALLSRP